MVAWGGCRESPSLRWDRSGGEDVLGGVEQGPHLQGVGAALGMAELFVPSANWSAGVVMREETFIGKKRGSLG